MEFGLKLVDGVIKCYVRNITTSSEIESEVEEKVIGQSDFIIQYNGYRALRPMGKILGLGQQQDLPSQADKCVFFCQDPKQGLSLLNREPLIQIPLLNWKWNIYYNAFPIEKEGHFLLVPVVDDGIKTIIPHLEHKLTNDFLEDILFLFENNRELYIFFNSLHGGATGDHLHFQILFHKQILAIEKAPIIKKGKVTILNNYPARSIVFDSKAKASEIFPKIDFLQSKRIPFDLNFIGERIYLIPRNLKHEVVEEFPNRVLGAIEFAGKIITTDKNIYDNMNYAKIQTAFRKTTTSLEGEG